MRLHADASLTLTWPLTPWLSPSPPFYAYPFHVSAPIPLVHSQQARGRPWHRCGFCTPGRGSAPAPPFLPQGSFKRAKKEYEEIHVPAPKSMPVVTGELMPITDLPEWARQGFPGLKTLNFFQSKLYPIAFGTDEPILLCALTGAGEACLITCSLWLDTYHLL
jgi:hypothetical protein